MWASDDRRDDSRLVDSAAPTRVTFMEVVMLIRIREEKESYSRTGQVFRAYTSEDMPLYMGEESRAALIERVKGMYPSAEFVDVIQTEVIVTTPSPIEMLEKAQRQIAKAIAAVKRGDAEAAVKAIDKGATANLNAARSTLIKKA